MLFLSFLLTFLSAHPPVLLLPGVAGSQIQYRNYDWDSWGYLWLNSARTIPLLKDSYIKDMAVVYSAKDDSYGSSVKYVRPYSFGTVDGVDHVDSLLVSETYYYHQLISALEDAGYSNGKDLVGAPFDFRTTTYKNAPNTFFPDLKNLIETTVGNNGGQPLLVVSHSQGALVLRHFLANFVSADWKQQYIRGWVSASGAFGGASEALHLLCSYKEFLIPDFTGQDMNNADSFFAGLFWMLPSKYGYSGDSLLANVTITDGDSFTITLDNITEAFSRGIGGDHTTAAQNFVNNINSEFTPPGVELWLYYGSGKDTTDSEDYTGKSGDWWKQDGAATNVDGDSMVPLASLLAPTTQWQTDSPIHVIEKAGENHNGMLSNGDFIADTVGLALNTTEHEALAADGVYAHRRQYALAITTVAKDQQHALALRLKALRTHVGSKLVKPSTVAVEKSLEQIGVDSQAALIAAIQPMNEAVAAGEQRLRQIADELLARYGPTKDLLARAHGHGRGQSSSSAFVPPGPGVQVEAESEVDAAVAKAKLDERNRLFAVEAAVVKENVLSIIEKAMRKANRVVDEVERKLETLLSVSA